MVVRTFKEIATLALREGAILNKGFPGFREDYLLLHCLIKKYKPKTFFEVGTNIGVGTKIIKNAMPPKGKVYSLDLPTELAHLSLKHPISEGKGDRIGYKCNLPYTQLRGDSLTFDFSQYPCEGYYIDGEHDFEHAFHESKEIVKQKPRLIVWHDTDIECVMQAVKEALAGTDYILYRVVDTRISYAVNTRK